jgi:hypothetical protein
MIKVGIKALVVLGFLVGSNAYAAPIWVNNLTVKSTSHYWTGSLMVVEIAWNESTSTGCADTDTNHRATGRWAPSSDTFSEIGLNTAKALAALSANMKIDILMDPANCAAGMGAFIWGSRVHN